MINGECKDKQCKCNPGYSGVLCDQPVCPNNCNEDKSQGKCDETGKCLCKQGKLYFYTKALLEFHVIQKDVRKIVAETEFVKMEYVNAIKDSMEKAVRKEKL